MKAPIHRHVALLAAALSLALTPLAHAATATAPSATTSELTPDALVQSMRSDDALLQRVANALANDPELADSDITVLVGEGKVALEGLTHNARQAVRAVAVTRRAAGDGVEVMSGLRSVDLHDAAGA
jgi:osmotically-inducible protein OsmY